MAVTIPEITPKYPEMPDDRASELVREKYIATIWYANNAFFTAKEALEALKDLFPIDIPGRDIDYEYISAELGISIGPPPEEPEFSFTKPTPPSCGDFLSVEIPTITIPDPPGDPAAEFIYNEPIYQSQMLEDLKAALIAYLESGGTGLSATVEAALWARAEARKDLLNEKVYNEALNFFAARGFALPPGALTGRLTEALKEQARASAQINYEIMIEQARLAQTNTHFTITSAIQLEGQEREYFDKVATRAFNKARALVDVIINVYNAKMQGYIAKMEGKKAEIDLARMKGELVITANRNTTEVFQAMVSKYEAELRAEIGIIEAIGRIYGFQTAGYEAKARVAIGELNAQVELFKGRVEQSNNQTKLAVMEAEMVLRAYIEAVRMQVAAAEGAANVSAQLAASAMSAVNASASVGYGSSFARGDGVRAATAISAAKSLSERVEAE